MDSPLCWRNIKISSGADILVKETISHISISGFKSIRELQDFELRDLNIIIGANGVGKAILFRSSIC